MPAEEEAYQATEKKKKNVLVGLIIDSHSRELLNWALVKVAEPGDSVIAVHVCRSSGIALKGKPLLDSYLEVYNGLCSLKKVNLTGQISTGISVRRTLVREAKKFAAVAVVVGISKRSALGNWTSIAKYCARRLPPTTDVLAIHSGIITFRRCNNDQLPGLNGDLKPSLGLNESRSLKDFQSEFGDSEADTETSSFEVLTRDGNGNSKDEVPSLVSKKRPSSPFSGEVLDQRPGWPLLRRASLITPVALVSRELSVVQWAMSLPNRSPPASSTESPFKHEKCGVFDEPNRLSSCALSELANGLEILLKANSCFCKWFSYETLKTATSKFCSENMIGKGGCSQVYKGILQDGKHVAVKVRKSLSQEARNDFANEIEIISSLKQRNITPLTGVCITDTDLISVYDYFSKGSLEENLRGKNKEKSSPSWEVRFDVAVRIAEALNYLHNECSPPVIHRDVKSSNILLSDRFEPQLSDFGLAKWGPKTSSFVTEGHVVGTFGYLAPEYFMYGNVSDKIDVYAFGVVLLELLSGRSPIGSETSKGQESLVMWAKPMIEGGNARGLLDPNLEGKFDEAQMQRMVLAATLCYTRAARLRPKMSEILKLLKGVENWMNPQSKDLEDLGNQDDNHDDEVYPNSSAELHLSLALLDVDDDSTSLSGLEQGNSLSTKDYLKERWRGSSSFY